MSLDISLHQDAKYNTQVYEANITHNLGKIASKVICFGIENHYENIDITLYDILWHGNGLSAKVIAPMLEVAVEELFSVEMESPYSLWKFTKELLKACKEFPETTLHCHR